jgi:hypothetical protein
VNAGAAAVGDDGADEQATLAHAAAASAIREARRNGARAVPPEENTRTYLKNASGG